MDNETRENLVKFIVPTVAAVAVALYVTTKPTRKARKQYKEDRMKEIRACRLNFATSMLAYMGSDDFDHDKFEQIWNEEKEFLNIVEKHHKK